MALIDALDRYLDAWNDHDAAAVVASLTEGGTYEDPTTGGPLSGDALAASVDGLVAGFPDVHFDVVSCAPTGDTSAALQWRMTGTNTGPMPGGPATGGSIDLPGADFVTYDPTTDRLATVQGYFDTATMLEQLGLQAHITPSDTEGVTKFGYAMRVETGRDTVPGAFTLTWIEIEPEYHPALVEATSNIVVEQLANDDYLGGCVAAIGRRHYTFNAWTSVAAADAALQGRAHSEAMRLAHAGGVGDTARGITSVWVPERLNGVFHPGTGASWDLSELGGQWL
jgi:steroid delta-isomerase-like uncharacterized protein